MSLHLFDLSGKIALITGAAQGIGRALAEGLARAGAYVVLNGCDEAKLATAATALRVQGLQVSYSAFDVTDAGAVDARVSSIESSTGAIDILINNAGIQRRAPLEELPVEAWHELVRTNLDSVFYVSRAVARHMIAARSSKSPVCKARPLVILSLPTLRPKERSRISPAACARIGFGTACRSTELGPDISGRPSMGAKSS